MTCRTFSTLRESMTRAKCAQAPDPAKCEARARDRKGGRDGAKT